MDVLRQDLHKGVRVCLVLVFVLGALVADGEESQYLGQWPSFRGPHASGAADGHELPLSWDIDTSEQVAWRIAITGLAHSSPIVWDGLIYLTSAVAADSEVGLITGDVSAAGIDPAADLAPHEWHLFAIDLADGCFSFLLCAISRR